MKLVSISASGFYGFEQTTIIEYINNRVICVGANGTGKSNILKLVEFFLVHGTGVNVKLHWEQVDSIWEPQTHCIASLRFSLAPDEVEVFAKWRLTAILSLLMQDPQVCDLLAVLEEQDVIDTSLKFSNMEVFPEDAEEEYGIDDCPLFRKLRCQQCGTSRRVKLFWELLESVLLSVYSTKKPYTSAVYYAHTEERDTAAVVFQQILCDDDGATEVLKRLHSGVANKITSTIPPPVTLEDEIRALRIALCETDSQKILVFNEVSLAPALSLEVWSKIEEGLRYGFPHIDHEAKKSSRKSAASQNSMSSSSMDIYANLTCPTHWQRTTGGGICLVNCGFTAPLLTGRNPATNSLADVRSWCTRLLMTTESHMTSRPIQCQIPGVRGITHVLRRLLLRSVCILSQERGPAVSGMYKSVSQHNVHSMVEMLMKSASQANMLAIQRIQEGMKGIMGQDAHFLRLMHGGILGVDITPGLQLSIKSAGGGYQELLMVLCALHGTSADTVLLDSPGFSLHPPQQKALALWISKSLYHESCMSNKQQRFPGSILVVTNSTEFVTEDALPCIYCFRRRIVTYESFTNSCQHDHPRGKVVTRVCRLHDGVIRESDILKILDPALSRLVFATGVFFFEGPSDYRVIEALKHLATSATWEIAIMHGTGEMSRVVSIADALGIPYGIVVDYDQVMPTISGVKHNNSLSIKLWRSSPIYRFLCDRRKTISSNSFGSTGSQRLLSESSDHSAQEIFDALNSFRRHQGKDDELTQKLQDMASELQTYINRANALNGGLEDPSVDIYSSVSDTIENIISDCDMNIVIRSALLRQQLRSVGIFCWNADIEGMIFGYGDPVHEQAVLDSMPSSMKSFCMEQEQTLSGIAYDAAQRIASSHLSKRGRKGVKTFTNVIDSSVDDYDRLVYLIRSSPAGSLLSKDIPRAYRIAFGCKLSYHVNGVQQTFRSVVGMLSSNPSISVADMSSKCSVSECVSETESDEGEDEDEEASSECSESSFDLQNEADTELDFRKPKKCSGAPNIRLASTPTSGGSSKVRPNSNVGSYKLPILLFSWVGAPPESPCVEHVDHVFRKPEYWKFVGSVLHGGRNRGGMWKHLPWNVLKDLIQSAHLLRMTDNTAGKFMSSADIRRYGKHSSTSRIHIGLSELLEWMYDMEARKLFLRDV